MPKREPDPVAELLARYPKPDDLVRIEERERQLRAELVQLERENNELHAKLAGIADALEDLRRKHAAAVEAVVEGREPPDPAMEKEKLLRRQEELHRRRAFVREALREVARRREAATKAWAREMAPDMRALLEGHEKRIAGLYAGLCEAVAALGDLLDDLRRRGVPGVPWPRVLPLPQLNDPRQRESVSAGWLRRLAEEGLCELPEALAERWREQETFRRELEESSRPHGAVSMSAEGMRIWDADRRAWVAPETFRDRPGRFAHAVANALAKALGARG